MTKRALVLAGGGVAGIAWETGILQGIADEDSQLAATIRGSDVVVGTSAGSVVGAQLGCDLSLADLFARQSGEDSAEATPGVAFEKVLVLLGQIATESAGTQAQRLQRLGRSAVAAETVTPAARRAIIEARLPSLEWPDRDLRITGVDVDSGQLRVFTRESGVALAEAVEASCAVPGAWPVVEIDGHRYMDGGMASNVNMSVAGDCDIALVLVPSRVDSPALFGPSPGGEVEYFDGPSLGIYADADSLTAYGMDPLSPACRVPSALAGRAQGRRVAAEVGDFFDSH